MAQNLADKVKQPKNLSPRVKWLRDYFFEGVDRKWNNEYNGYSTGTPWDIQFNEITYYIVPETFQFIDTFRCSFQQVSEIIEMEDGFFKMPLVERKAHFTKRAIVERLPAEILPGDLLCGARFNMQYSMCLTKKETKDFIKLAKRARKEAFYLHNHGYGNSGATSGHLIPDYAMVLNKGFKGIYAHVKEEYDKLPIVDKTSQRGAELRAMMESAEIPRDLAKRYATLCRDLASKEKDEQRKSELLQMAKNMDKVPWEPAENFYEAIQSLWFSHMLVMSDEKYPGPGVSFGRIDQYLYPFYKKSIDEGMTEEFMKEILGCFWFHCNTAYDAQMRVGGNQGISAGFGQLFNLSGMGKDGKDMTNDLTYLFLDVIDDMSPILEPKPNVRLHKGTPEKLLNRVVDMIAESQGAPFLLNFDERAMAGMLREAKKAHVENLINVDNVFDYASVGCLENTMVGNDRSGTVDNNIHLLKAMELVYNQGKDFLPYVDFMTGKESKLTQEGPKTPDPLKLDTFDAFFEAYKTQLFYMVDRMCKHYDFTDSIRNQYMPTPYLSLLVHGCAESGRDVAQGGAELSFTTMEGISFATTVDSLLAVKYLVYDKKICTMEELLDALRHNWEGYDVLRSQALHKAPKYGRDDPEADAMATKLMDTWSDEVWKHKTTDTNRQFRPGMLSWNYWVGGGSILKASANGRKNGEFLSNAICPSNGADINGPTSNSNSVGKALGGRGTDGDFLDYKNSLPNGASHTITFNASLLRTEGHKEKFKAFLRGYIENGGTALQINILDPEMLKDAQEHPSEYRHLLVRVTGYNAYFTSIGRELQNEIIARESHGGF